MFFKLTHKKKQLPLFAPILNGFIIIAILLFTSSCEKEVHINLNPGEGKVVVEGRIELGEYPYVSLTQNMSFFSKIDLNTLEDLFIHDAHITVSDGQDSIVLKEYPFAYGDNTIYVYTIDSADALAQQFKGAYDKTYFLKIQLGDQVYTSQTTIPRGNGLDSLWAQMPDRPGEVDPEARMLYARYTDPDTLGNFIRYATKVNRGSFLTPFFSVSDDQIINGTSIPFRILPGYIPVDTIDRATYGFFMLGDTVTVQWSSIDKSTYDFWDKLEFAQAATGNPFAAPTAIPSNISNNALGIWAGYGHQYYSIVIKDDE